MPSNIFINSRCFLFHSKGEDQEKEDEADSPIDTFICHIISCFTLWSSDQILEFLNADAAVFFLLWCWRAIIWLLVYQSKRTSRFSDATADRMQSDFDSFHIMHMYACCPHTSGPISKLYQPKLRCVCFEFQITTVRSFYVLLHAAYIIISFHIKSFWSWYSLRFLRAAICHHRISETATHGTY